MFAFGWSSCGRKPEHLEETHLSDLVTTMTISHADAGYRTRVAAVIGECVNTAPARHTVLVGSRNGFDRDITIELKKASMVNWVQLACHCQCECHISLSYSFLVIYNLLWLVLLSVLMMPSTTTTIRHSRKYISHLTTREIKYDLPSKLTNILFFNVFFFKDLIKIVISYHFIKLHSINKSVKTI